MDSKPVFLFGSGADTDSNSNMKSGQAFSEALLVGKYKDQVNGLLNLDLTNFKLVSHNSTKVFVQTVATFSEEAKSILEDADIENFKKYYCDRNSVEFSSYIKPKCSEWYDILTKPSLEAGKNDKNERIKQFFHQNAVFFDTLDEKFNSLKNEKLNDSAKRVMNAYASIFVLMMQDLYDLEGFQWNFENVISKLNEPYDTVCSSDSYYQLLRKSNLDCNVVTTNYTKLAEQGTGKSVIYLHGNMTWFEDLSDLSVYDCLDESDAEHLLNAERKIPFILIPSGVKPLICTKQIKQFSDFIDALESTDELCVIGYRFNSEDNHINSIIAEWLRKENHRLVYFNFGNNVNFSKFGWAKHFSHNLIDCSFGNKLELSDDKIQNIVVNNSKNSRNAFSDYLTMIQEKENGYPEV